MKFSLGILTMLFISVTGAATTIKVPPPGRPCGSKASELSLCMLRAALDDVEANYKKGGGGITEIRLRETRTLAVSLAQEERTDIRVYKFKVDKSGRVTIVSIDEETKSHPAEKN